MTSFDERWIDAVYSRAAELGKPLHEVARLHLEILRDWVEQHERNWQTKLGQTEVPREPTKRPPRTDEFWR